ncbi:MAG: carboxypeptidase regulatory-like protein [Sphingobacteriales bacterium]|nr:carboxypeptidase regulatory-like protein [Sphingobacteriales bacterium]
MNTIKIYFVLIGCILLNMAAFAQTDSIPLSTILEKSTKYLSERPTEKVYLHFDKPYYSVGDTIYFKAYLTMGAHVPSELSKIVYTEVLNEQDSIVKTVMLPVTNSTAVGNILLSQYAFKQGNYHIRAYTTWMLNFDDAYFFHKTFYIGNTIDKHLITHVTYQSSLTDKGTKINAKILYKDQDGVPLANKKVNWKYLSNFDVADKGRETTDENGYLNISLNVKQAEQLKNAVLTTSILTTNENAYDSYFPLKAAIKATDVQFFPEGGMLLTEVKSKVAFKAIKSDGLGIDIKGTVVDNTGKNVLDFASQHLGMGVLEFIPEVNKTYKALVKFPDGTQTAYPLPEPQTEGINVFVKNTDPDNVSIKLVSNKTFIENNRNKAFYIVGQSAGIICYAAQVLIQGGSYTAIIPKSKFPTGILQFTLFSSEGYVYSERIVFINKNDQMKLSLTTDRQVYSRRQKVKMTISAKNDAIPTEFHLSVAVIDETKVPFDENAETTILSSLLLSSDIKGYIEKPNYYFRDTSSIRKADLDVLMLTQGFRKFNYDNILTGKYPAISFLAEQGINIRGTLRMNNGMTVNRGSVSLQIPDKSITATTTTDIEGRFAFEGLVFPDSSKVILSARNNTNARNMTLSVDGINFPAVTNNMNVPDEILNIDSVLAPYLQNSKRQYARILNEVVVKSTKIVKKASHMDYSALSGLSVVPDHLIDGESLKGCNILLNCLQSMAMGITYSENNFYITRDYNAGKRVPAQIFLSGQPVDVGILSGINPSEVESVEIFLKDELGLVNKMYQTNGVIAINMRKIEKQKISFADLQNLIPKNNVVTFTPLGYSKVRQFYSPKYETTLSKTQGIDLRTTIYWNPKVLTDKNGTAVLEFYNADSKGTYKAIVEGFDKDGNVGRFVYRYKLQ